MSKQELAALIQKLMKIQNELAEIAIQLKFIPVSESSSDTDDDDAKIAAWTPKFNQCPHN